jgi:hypothetical protein
MEENRAWSRRQILQTASAATLGGLSSPTTVKAAEATPTARARDPERIRRENERPGTRDWLTTHVRVDPATKYRSPWIEGYASKTSVRPGETIAFHVSTNPGSPFVLEIFRLGYYQGLGGRSVWKSDTVQGTVQPDPAIGAKRLRECAWSPSIELTIPAGWTSGVYLGKLTAEREGLQSYVIFVLRDDREADFLFQVSDNTWNAYNRWPSQFSLYDDGRNTWYWGPDVRTSFDRPYGKYCQIFDAPLSVGSGEFLLWEFPLAYWMEQQGYDVSYISNLDTHADPDGLLRAKGWISVGHDEYWSLAMFENVKRAAAEGVNLAFLSGNAVCGVVDIASSGSGEPNRTIERVGLFGGIGDEAEGFPDMKRLTLHGPSESTLIGARSAYPVTGGGPWVCRKPDHWLFAGTGMKAGDGIPGLVGWEWHGDPAPLPGLEVVASGPTSNGSKSGVFTSTIYPGPKENIVFNAATIWWSDGLSEPPGYLRPAVYTKPQGPDPRVQRITRNLFDRMRGV